MLIKQENMDGEVENSDFGKERHMQGQASPRRRKNGAFVRPNLIDVVGQPKHKVSTVQDEEISELQIANKETGRIVDDEFRLPDSCLKGTEHIVDHTNCSLVRERSLDGYSEQLENIENLIRGLIVKELDVKSDGICNEKMERKISETKKCQELRKKRSVSEKDIKIGKVIEWDDDDRDHVLVELPLRNTQSLKEKNYGSGRKTSLSRSCSLPETRKSRSKFMNFVRGRQSSFNSRVSTSDGEGSGQSIISYESTSSSSHGKRSRTSSVLSRSAKCSSPMSDKRSRTGSLITNRTGCPQYFIPGANRGRIFMEPLDLFDTKTICIKGISFRIMKDIPRTHRAISMVGCMGFAVPAPSRYFER